MNKEDNIFKLYDKLGNSGEKSAAIAFISEKTGVKRSSIKANWFLHRELPENLKRNDNVLDEIIKYLQNKVALQNESISA